MRITCFAALVLLNVASPSIACEIDTPTDWLPGFTEEQVSERRDAMLRAGSAIQTYLRVRLNFEKAPTVYLARVLNSESGVTQSVYRTTVQPLKSFKGRLPVTKTLIADFPSSCGGSNGDGDTQFARKDELVIVFEGLQKRKGQPRGLDSIRMIDVTYGALLDPVQEWLQSQPGYGESPKEPRQ